MAGKQTSTKVTSRRRSAQTELEELPEFATGQDFDELSEADKQKVFNYYSTQKNLAGLGPLDKAEQKTLNAQRAAGRKKVGRPLIGEGSKPIAVTIEAGLLRRVDEYAKAHGFKRTQLIARGLRMIVG